MPSPSTNTLRSGTLALSRFSGGGAFEKSCWIRLGCCCWNGVNRSPPNQPPPPPKPPPNPPLRGGGRAGPPKLKNCAEAGPTTPTMSATATPSAINGPVSVNTLRKDFGFNMRFGRDGNSEDNYNSGIRPQAGRFRSYKPSIGLSRQGLHANVVFSGVSGPKRTSHRPRSRSSTSEEAN